MKKSILLILLIAVCLPLAFFGITLRVHGLEDGDLSAKSAILYEPSERIILYGKNIDARLPMASTTKIMTALLALECSAPPDTIVTVPKEAVGIEGSSLYLEEGDKYRLIDLVYALMLQSANDVAATLAISISGSTDAFADLMNQRAAALRMKDTHYKNPHGLHDAEHYTTARDLAILCGAALENPLFAQIVSTYRKVISPINRSVVKVLVNHNKLLRVCDGAIGIKTGYTKTSGRCLAGAAIRDDLTLIAVTLDAPNDWQDHTRLFEYGFENFENRLLASTYEIAFEIPVINGKTASVLCSNDSDVYAVLPLSDQEVEAEVILNRFATAPIRTGQVLGHVVFKIGDRELASVDLTAKQSIPAKKYKKGIFDFFK
ncbi:MAG: D-alanyl-D-alanine carboxypeptidase [Clostridia bacterium]|nr:D-alanyl-D-alanine carboxypeptidase [Clostridia bacterium]